MAKRQLSNKQIAEIQFMRDEGMSMNMILKRTGHCLRTVERHYYTPEFNAWLRDFYERWDNMRKLFGVKTRQVPKNKDEEFALQWEEMRRLYGKG